MRRIILGIVSILVLGGLVFGATQAWFSDTETSTGNILTAGSIDLKVDHAFASYNGQDCTGECIPTGSQLLFNDDFEGPPTVTHATGWDIFDDETPGLGWRVEWVNATTPFGGFNRPAVAKIEFHRNGNLANTNDIPDGWVAHSGTQYIELDSDWTGHTAVLNNEPALVRIYQDIATVPGTKYELKYWHSYRPGRGLTDNTMNVQADGVNLRTVTADGTGQTSTSWVEYVDVFTATDASTRIEFEGAGDDNSFGIFLDDISLFELSCTTQIGNNQCNLWEEKDLEEDDFFWNFDDVKPGDYGRNVISYHIYDNDAWMCTLLDVVDEENVIIEPEADAGDVSDPPGELSKYIRVFVWHDDGDGVFETGEVQIADDTLDNMDNWPIAESPNPAVVGDTTEFIGVSWCLGAMTVNQDNAVTPFACDGAGDHNDAQTDVVNVVLNFYAEQSRNNPDFKCSEVVLGDE